MATPKTENDKNLNETVKEKDPEPKKKEKGKRDRGGIFLLVSVLVGTALCVVLLTGLLGGPKEPGPGSDAESETDGAGSRETGAGTPDPGSETGAETGPQDSTETGTASDPDAESESEQNLVLDSGIWSDPRPREPGVRSVRVFAGEAEP